MPDKVNLLIPIRIIQEPKKNFASAGVIPPTAQPDLMFMESILVSTGENKNDDVFLPEEMWKARKTPAYKPVDWEHNTGRELTAEERQNNPGKVVVDNQTIGVMYNTYVVDKDGLVVDESKIEAGEAQIPDNFHIIDEAVIWKGLYPSVAASIEEGAKNKDRFVSMEAWFTDYDYLVGNKVVARNEETAFLDNMLRARGGNGVYENTRVRRALRGITFGGKGIVARPANEPSIITNVTHEPLSTKASCNDAIKNNIISDITKIKAYNKPEESGSMSDKKVEVNPSLIPLEHLTKANEELVLLKSDVSKKNEELIQTKAKSEEFEKKLELLKSVLVKGSTQLEVALPGFTSKVSVDNPENFFSVLAEMIETGKVDISAKLKEALAKIAKIEEDARVAARETKLDSVLANMYSDADKRKAKKEKLVSSLKTLSDDAFANLIETLSDVKAEDMMKPADEKKKEKEEKKSEEMKMKSECSAQAKQVAKLLGIDENLATAAIAELNGVEIDEAAELDAVLKSVKAKEATPPAGSDSANQGVDLSQAYGSLVQTILNSHKPSDK